MPLVQSVASSLVGRATARRVSRAIPNPIIRQLAVVAITALAPIVIQKIGEALQQRRVGGRARRTAFRATQLASKRLHAV